MQLKSDNDWWKKPRRVSVCVDTVGWFDQFAHEIVSNAVQGGDDAVFVRRSSDVQSGGVAFYLSCMKITPPEDLARNHQNVVVHARALPQGRGFSPIVWQVLEGKHRIPISMLFAADAVDSGDILMRDELHLQGFELNDEIRSLLGAKIIDMVGRYLQLPEPACGIPQRGEPSWYRRRYPRDSCLDPARTIAEQFDLLRVVDNERYPAFFEYRGHRYSLKIERED